MKYPKDLKRGGRIGFIAPSFGPTTQPYKSRFESALKKFESEGYSCVIGRNCYENCGIGKSNTAEKCGEEINRFFCDDICDVVLSTGGGETMCEDLNFVDFEAISKAAPKWFMGMSDNTNLVFTLTTIADICAVYGPNANDFGRKPVHKSLEDAFGVLTGSVREAGNYPKWEIDSKDDEPLCAYNCTIPFDMRIYQNGEFIEKTEFSGRLVGGCLDSLVNLCGTKFDRVKEFNNKYKKEGLVWFFEACDLTPIGIRRAVWQLKNAGWFDSANGFIVGRALLYDSEDFGLNRITAVTEILRETGLPVVFDADIGHLPPMMPVISGSFAKVTARNQSLLLQMS